METQNTNFITPELLTEADWQPVLEDSTHKTFYKFSEPYNYHGKEMFRTLYVESWKETGLWEFIIRDVGNYKIGRGYKTKERAYNAAYKAMAKFIDTGKGGSISKAQAIAVKKSAAWDNLIEINIKL